MRTGFLIKFAILNFWGHKLRAILTTMAVTIGIAAIIFLVSLGFGLEKLVTEQVVNFEAFAIIDVPSANLKTMSVDDQALDRLRNISHVIDVQPSLSFAGRFSTEDNSSTTEVVINGASKEYFQYAGMRATNGKLPAEKDEIAVSDDYAKLLNVSPESLVGKNVTLEALVPTEYLDRSSEGYDASIQVGTKKADYKIVGIVPTQKTPTIVMDISGLKKISVGSYASSKVKVDDQANVEGVRKQIENIGYSTEYVGDTVSQITQVFSVFRLILGLFGLVALAVAAIGTFNTLTISLLERIREIGLLKALGMGNRDIYKLFISESLFISLIGGIFGIIIGVGIGQIINSLLGFMATQAHADTAAIFVTPVAFGVGTAIFSLVVGFLTGWYPARRAVKTNALDALRYE